MDGMGRNRKAKTATKEKDLEFEWGAIEPVSRKYDAMGGQIDGLTEKSDFNEQLDKIDSKN